MDEVRTIQGHIRREEFPCVMAKAVEKIGGINISSSSEILNPGEISRLHSEFESFVQSFRRQEKLSSFILICHDERYRSFEVFENEFWKFLKEIRKYDQKFYSHDSRVSDDPTDNKFSFSISSEAFFILLLHPDSPRLSRRLSMPAIVFNPHIQFERMRKKGIFKKVQNIIRLRDKLLQGCINPMLSDFGDKSEVFQYTGRIYAPDETLPLFH